MVPRAVFPATGRGPMLHLVAAEGRAKRFPSLRCPVPLSLRGVLGKMAVTLNHHEHYAHREQAHE